MRISIIMIVTGLLLAGCGSFGESTSSPQGSTDMVTADSRIDGAGTFTQAARKRSGCGTVQSPPNDGRQHVPTTQRVRYKSNPPTSGSHWSDPAYPAPVPWGVYDEELRDEQLVHNLEHGHILVLYRGLAKDELHVLLDEARQVMHHLVVAPRSANPETGVYYVAWDHSLHCDTTSAAALQHMIDEYRNQGPELLMNDPGKKQ